MFICVGSSLKMSRNIFFLKEKKNVGKGSAAFFLMFTFLSVLVLPIGCLFVLEMSKTYWVSRGNNDRNW